MKEVICGIYKITSPTNKIYVGQSINCNGRINNYRNLHCKTQRKLYYSIKKYGWESHKFEIVHVCPSEQLNELEKHYVDIFQCFNSDFGLNLMDGGGNSGSPSQETIRLRAQSLMKTWKKKKENGNVRHTVESIKKISDGRKLTWIKQREQDSWNSPEEKMKRSNVAKNKKIISHSEKSKQNMRDGWAKYKKSDLYNSVEAKNKRSNINKGRIAWNKGSIGVMVAWNKGKPCTEDRRRKNSESGKKDWEKRKASGRKIWSEETQKKKSIAMKKFYEKQKENIIK